MTVGASASGTEAPELEALRRELERLRVLAVREHDLLDAILNHSPHGIIVCDKLGKLTLHNRAAERIWGGSASAEEMNDWARYRAFHADGTPFEAEDWSMARALTLGQTTEAEEIRFQRFDGSFGVMVGSSAPILDAEGVIQGALSVFADITPFMDVEAKLRARERELATLTRRSLERSERLLAISVELAKALTPVDVARVVTEHGAVVMGASAVMAGVVRPDGEYLELLASSGYSGEVIERFASVRLDAPLPINDAIRRREPVLLPTLDDRRRAYPELEDVRELIGLKAMAMLPLMVDDRAVGGLGFHFDHELILGDEERALMSSLANQCAQALQRTQLYEQEQRARRAAEDAQRQTAQLYQLTASVNRAATLEEVYEPAIDTVQGALGVERASVLLFDSDGVMRFKAWRGLSHEYRLAVEGHSPWTADSPDPRSIFIADVEQDPTLAAYSEIFRKEKIRALGFVPLVHHKLLGKFMIYSAEPRVFSDHEVQLAEAIAVHVAQAVARQRASSDARQLYLDAEAARRKAEEAVQARENLLAVVSHDLRNPLSTILVSASRLGDKKETDRRHAETIQRSALRMRRLIEDLVDLAAIDVNALPIEPEVVDAGMLLTQALELLGPLAAEKRQQLAGVTLVAELKVLADPERILQVLSNVIGNAIKFAPVGGLVEVNVVAREGHAEFSIIDDGPGIAPADLPYIFERYWQSKPQVRGGIGLGLSIAKGIIQAHGGRIWAESGSRPGAIIRFTLPLSV